MRNNNYYQIIAVILVICLFGLALFAYLSLSPYRWSAQLYEAIRQENTETALALIEEGQKKGYSPDTLNTYPSFLMSMLEATPQTPLQAACRYGNLDVVLALLEAGASVRPAEGGIRTEPVFCVIRRHWSSSDAEIIRLLIAHGATLEDDDFGPLITDAAFRAPLDFCAEPNSVTGQYPYSEAAACGITETFLLLAEYKDCYVENGAQRNALHCAAIMANWPLVKVLATEFNYPLDAKDIDGKTAYDLADEAGATEIVLDLLR